MNFEGSEKKENSSFQNLSKFNDKLIEKLAEFFGSGESRSPHQNFRHSEEMVLESSPSFLNYENYSEPFTLQKTTTVQNKDCLAKAEAKSLKPNEGAPKGSPFSAKDSVKEHDFRLWENSFPQSDTFNGEIQNTEVDKKDSDIFCEYYSGHFESDSEEQSQFPMHHFVLSKNSNITFLSYLESKETVFQGKGLFSLKETIDILENRNSGFRRYECDQCLKKFYNPAALGGHKSKQHPRSSKRYAERKTTYSLRSGERKKRSFLNNL